MDELEQIAGGAQTASGEPISAICEACGETFAYTPAYLPWRDAPLRRPLCDPCAERAAQEAREERALEEKRGRYEMATLYVRGSERGSRLARASFADFSEGPHNTQALTLATTWLAEERKPNLIVVGPIKSGKSYLAACLYNALHAQWEPAYWLNAGTLMAQIRRGFSDRESAATAGQRMENAERAPVLVLDDLGKVHPGKDVSWVEETFYAIVEARYRDELPTIVTTEWKSEALAERVGPSVVSRLEDGAWVTGLRQPDGGYRRPAKVTR